MNIRKVTNINGDIEIINLDAIVEININDDVVVNEIITAA